MTDLLRWSQFIAAIIGAALSAVWFVVERRRVRYIPFMWGLWCMCLVAFRVAVFYFPAVHTPEQVIILNSISNTVFLLGAVNVIFITANHIIGVLRHDRLY
jgi:cytochrome bd-type quinol oxidase subunit 2